MRTICIESDANMRQKQNTPKMFPYAIRVIIFLYTLEGAAFPVQLVQFSFIHVFHFLSWIFLIDP